MEPDPILDRLRALVAQLPETVETITWGHPHWRVANKIFAGYEAYHGVPVLGFRTDLDEQEQLIQQPKYSIAPYTGKYGGVCLQLTGRIAWKRVEQHLATSWRIVAPKALVKRYFGS